MLCADHQHSAGMVALHACSRDDEMRADHQHSAGMVTLHACGRDVCRPPVLCLLAAVAVGQA